MSNSDSRSLSGCWTCRARRKKCDESDNPCNTCTRLHLTCHGYGPRPVWMDGNIQEKVKVLEFKAVVKRYSRQRQKSKVVGVQLGVASTNTTTVRLFIFPSIFFGLLIPLQDISELLYRLHTTAKLYNVEPDITSWIWIFTSNFRF